MDTDAHGARPVIALAMGDPAGISPELTAKAEMAMRRRRSASSGAADGSSQQARPGGGMA